MADHETPIPATPVLPAPESPWVKPGLGFYSLTLFGIALMWTLYTGKDNYVMLMLGAVISLVNQGPWGFFFGNSSTAQRSADTIAADSAVKSAALSVSTPALTSAPVTTTTTIPPGSGGIAPTVVTTTTQATATDATTAAQTAVAANPVPHA